MQQSKKIDNSLMERRALLELIARLKEPAVSQEEMERIGEQFREAGRHALRPLLHELWREPSGELITRYAYLLDFFETGSWIEQLVQIAIKRRDLDDEAKAALLITLEGHGVDVDAPPFKGEFSGIGSAIGQAVQGSIRAGEDGIVTFLDEFLSYPADIQKIVIGKLPDSGEAQGVRMLEAMLWHEDHSIARASLSALGRVREARAAGVLALFLAEGDAELRRDAERSLRRLSFLGIETPPPVPLLPFHAGYATPPDGDGYRSLFISRWVAEGKLAVLYMQVHERRGLLAAWGAGGLDEEEFQAELEGFSVQDDLHRVPPEYVLALLKDALYWSRDLCYLPADFYMRRGMFAGFDLTPAPYHPVFDEYRRQRPLTYHQGEDICRELFSDDFFAGWFVTGERVHDFAEEYRLGEAREKILERFCSELLSPEVELIRERLLKSADLMRHCGRDGSFVGRLVALADSLGASSLPHHLHPFLRSFAIESIEIAREAMAEQDDSCLSAAEEG